MAKLKKTATVVFIKDYNDRKEGEALTTSKSFAGHLVGMGIAEYSDNAEVEPVVIKKTEDKPSKKSKKK